MTDIANFEKYKKEREKTHAIGMPSLKEIAILKALAANYDKDDMVDVAHWDGECWKTTFSMLAKYGKENGFYENTTVTPWDVFAVFMTKLLGTTFSFDENGNVAVETLRLGEMPKDGEQNQ